MNKLGFCIQQFCENSEYRYMGEYSYQENPYQEKSQKTCIAIVVDRLPTEMLVRLCGYLAKNGYTGFEGLIPIRTADMGLATVVYFPRLKEGK